MSDEKKCTCEWCTKTYPRFNAMIAATEGEVQAYIREIFENWQNVEEDNDWYICVLNGSWPNAKDILHRALTRAEKRDL